MELNSKRVTHIVVDMLYDFIDGSLACLNAEKAVRESVNYINANPDQRVIYVCDSHPANHCSFVANGGIWPPHCVAGTRGGSLHADYLKKVTNEAQRPSEKNIFKKGENPSFEQYSGYQAINKAGEKIGENPENIFKDKTKPVAVVSGIATEFCIRETVSDLLKEGYKVYILKIGLGYVDYNNHLTTLKELKDKGANLI